MSQADFLFELGTEELPPKALKTLRNALEKNVLERLDKAELSHGKTIAYAAPRRLALLIEGLETEQPEQSIQRRGPAIQAAYDADGNPTKAAEGFAKSCGIELSQAQTLKTDKGEWLYFEATKPGLAAAELLPKIFEESLAALPIPKRMRWGSGDAEFVRPVHWVVMIHGDAVVPCTLLDKASGNQTYGHRFHHPEAITITKPKAYAELLRDQGNVLADFEERKAFIKLAAESAASGVGGKAIIDPDLLEEVTALNEWPMVVMGSFEEKFLDVPAEALISSMQEHQKYFPVTDKEGKLKPSFITFSNIDSKDISQVRSGNERVIRPRLSDAEFFWLQDKKHRLESRQEALKNVVFQNKLGSVWDKSQRIAALAENIAAQIGAEPEHAKRAGELCKCDLNSEMVGEFPDLQGIMGRYYAQNDGEPQSVAEALEQYYWPKFSGDQLPKKGVSQAVAIAERVDTLSGIFAIGQLPTGVKDPFGLRRAALGLIRIIVEKQLDIDVHALIDTAFAMQPVKADDELKQKLWTYVTDRLKGYYLDQGISHGVFDAVASVSGGNLVDIHSRIRAVDEFSNHEAAASLAAGNKRISNILKKQENISSIEVDSSLLSEAQEQALASRVAEVSAEVAPAMNKRDYSECLSVLAGLKEDIDNFFEHVMVMTDDASVKNNRIALLAKTNKLFTQIADISLLQLEK